MKPKNVQFHSAYLIWLPSGVDDGYQLTQKQAALSSLVMSWLDNEWTRWYLLGKETTRDLVGYVLAGDWWVSYLWQGKVHTPSGIVYDGPTWYENDKLDCIKSLYYYLFIFGTLLNSWQVYWKMWLCLNFEYHMASMSLHRAWRYRKFSIDSCYKKFCQIFPVLI